MVKTYTNPRIFKEVKGELRLVASRCLSCGEVFFPKIDFCPKCHSRTEEIIVGKKGVLYSYTIARVGPLGYNTPYAFGFVHIPSENVLVYSLFTDHENLSIGMDMEFITEEITNKYGGKEAIYKFKPVRK